MRVRYSFSSRRTGHLENLKKQRQKYPALAQKIADSSDIILEIIDARFPEETRNIEFEEKIKNKNKKLIYVFNKADLTTKEKLKKFNYLYPRVIVSCKERSGIKLLRNIIKIESKKIKREDGERVVVGVIGYPNTGKSSLINSLIGKNSAPTASQPGFTKAMQKLRLDDKSVLLDSPGVIPEKEYSHLDKDKISQHAKVGARDYSQVKEPEIIIANFMKEYPGIFEKFYNINADGDSELLIEEFGKRKGLMKKGGKVNEDKTAREILKDWQIGKIKV